MMKILSLFLVPIFLFATEFKIATYNIENLFDTKKSGYEYKEYIPNSKSGWNDKMLSIKIKNIARVIKDIDADIISLEEVESKEVLKKLNLALGNKKYPYLYSSFKTKGLDVVLLSRYPIKDHNSYIILKRFRPIHRVVINIDGFNLTLFLNHWPSHRHSIQTRMKFSRKLKSISKKDRNYIFLGDFNSPLKKDKDGWGKSIKFVSKNNYNLWYDTPYAQRYSYKFYRLKNAIDHIIVSKSMYTRYLIGSFKVHRFDYLVDKYGNAKRWKISNKGRGKHLGIGYSDHFAISASFSTKNVKTLNSKEITIKELFSKKDRVNYILKNVMVIDKSKYGVLIEDKDGDAIYIYRPDYDLNIGQVYTLYIKKLALYKGKKEITLLDFNHTLDKIQD